MFAGQIICQAKLKTDPSRSCQKYAYYSVITNDNATQVCTYLCGQHSRLNLNRVELKKAIPSADEKNQLLKQLDMSIETAMNLNRTQGKPGSLMMCRLKMRTKHQSVPGFIDIFPNYRSGRNEKVLSPMLLGPIPTPIGICHNLENYHQGNKWLPTETKEEFERVQKDMYADIIPHRHKLGDSKINRPKCSVVYDTNGNRHELGYIETRQVYCTWYTRLIQSCSVAKAEFDNLRTQLLSGYNLRICGYESSEASPKTINEMYLNPKCQFGHELVLWSLLSLEPEEYPWTINQTLNL